MEWIKTMRKLSWSAPRLTTGLWAPLLRREYHGGQGMVSSAPPSHIFFLTLSLLLSPHQAISKGTCHPERTVLMWPLSLCRDKSAAEKRRQLIQESKFLGGDMEHTHLVKGLDFALLQKVSFGVSEWRVILEWWMLLCWAFQGEKGDYCCSDSLEDGPNVGLIAIYSSSLSFSFLGEIFLGHPGMVKSLYSLPHTSCTLAYLFCFTYCSYHTWLFNC